MSIRKRQAEQTKQKIVEAAHQIVRDEGFHALSSTKIVSVAGISKGGFFHHFPQIEDLYLYMLDQFMQRLDESLSPHQFESFQAYMHATSEYVMHSIEQSPESTTSLFYFLSQCQHKPEYQQRLRAMLNEAFAAWARSIRHYFAPELSDADLEHLVRIVDMYFCGLSFHYLISNDRPLYGSISREFTEMLTLFIDKIVSKNRE